MNYGKTLDDQRKGLIGDIEFNKLVLRDFVIHSLSMEPAFVNSLQASGRWAPMSEEPSACPGFFLASLHVNGSPKDTFIKLSGWGKGVVFINGKNLGRYWSIGPQLTLYLPGPWLRSGNNQLLVFEEQKTDHNIEFTSSPDYGKTEHVK